VVAIVVQIGCFSLDDGVVVVGLLELKVVTVVDIGTAVLIILILVADLVVDVAVSFGVVLLDVSC
jgi:hypothetical protein